jgi:hypothetical protein
MPALNCGSISKTSPKGHLVTGGSTGRVTLVDGTEMVELEERPESGTGS